jgi:hypothetical protein
VKQPDEVDLLLYVVIAVLVAACVIVATKL